MRMHTHTFGLVSAPHANKKERGIGQACSRSPNLAGISKVAKKVRDAAHPFRPVGGDEGWLRLRGDGLPGDVAMLSSVSGCVPNDALEPKTYTSSYVRASDHVRFLVRYQGRDPPRQTRRPWDLPAQQLNEFGPRGYNYFRVTQTEELRQRHQIKMAEAKRSPMLRAREAGFHLNPATGYAFDEKPRALPPLSDSLAGEYNLERSSVPTFSHYAAPVRALPPPRELVSARPTMAEIMQ
jgi:hypothetical protein